MIGFGAFNIDARGRIPGRFRFDLLGALSRLSSRMRMHGSTGIDLAYTASGVLGGAVVFGHHPWDNAAGVALVRAAGGVVTDLRGRAVDDQLEVGAGRRPRRARRTAGDDRRVPSIAPPSGTRSAERDAEFGG